MKDKEMIEEMAKVMYGYICKDRPCKECNYHGKSKILKPYCEYYLKAQDLYEKGYRKLPKDSVVLSREEFWKLSNKFSKKELDEIVEFHKKKTSKETAEKIFNRFLSVLKDNRKMGNNFVVLTLNALQDIAKEFGAEIKE